MEKSNEWRELFLGSMPKSKKHWSALALSKRMEKKGVDIEE